MISDTFSTTRTARYYILGEPGPHIRTCWMVLHGYGQLARYFLRRFDAVLDEHTLVVAPEALARFYTDQEGTKVGASWMTREHRLDDIADNMAFLDGIFRRLAPALHPECRFVGFGFSQGCATLMRWLLHARPPLKALVLYAGTIPDDLPYADHIDYLSSFPAFVTYGDQDEYLTPERALQYRAALEHTGLKLHYHVFEGKHTVEREVLQALKERLLGE